MLWVVTVLKAWRLLQEEPAVAPPHLPEDCQRLEARDGVGLEQRPERAHEITDNLWGEKEGVMWDVWTDGLEREQHGYMGYNGQMGDNSHDIWK